MKKLKSVLLVDDDDTTVFLNRFFIRQVDEFVEINTAVNGKEAIEFLKLNAKGGILPCLIILDVNMPVMDGWGFLEAFATTFDEAFKKSVSIVMLTSLDLEYSEHRALNNPNVTDTVQKPLSDQKFKTIIRKYFT